ncbi:MAG: glycosyltransferase [Pseudomonadales bacterium]
MRTKILHIVPSVSAGGIESLVLSLLEAIDRDKYIFELAVFNPHYPIHQDRIEELGAKVHFIGDAGGGTSVWSKIGWRIRAILNYSILIFTNKYDVLHCHNYSNFFLYVLLATVRGIPVRIVHSHSGGAARNTYSGLIMTKLRRKLAFTRLVTHRVGCSKVAANWIFGTVDRVKIIYNGIDLDRFSINRMLGKKRECREEGGKELVHIGRFSKQKNQLFMLNIFREIANIEDGYNFSIMGYGDLEDRLRCRVRELNLDDRLTFLRFDADVPGVLKDMDGFVLPSLWEGLPICAIEAQCAGVTTFLSDSVSKEVDIGMAQYISLDRSPAFWARYIVDTLNDGASPRQADSSVLQSFDINWIVGQYEDIYGGFVLGADAGRRFD